MTRVTIYSITDRGSEPQFFGEFRRGCDADDYVYMWRDISAKGGFLIRIDREES